MKKLNLFLISGLLVTLLACKKEEPKYLTSHLFWINKATKDSLSVNGFYYYICDIDRTPNLGDQINITPSDINIYYTTVPSCNDAKVQKVSLKLKKNESVLVNYSIKKVLYTNTGDFSKEEIIKNWKGTITLKQGECNFTQLVW